MKRFIALVLALVVAAPVFASASPIVMANPHPTKIVGSSWHDFLVSDDGAYNGNLWANVWPSDGWIGGYGYLQAADRYTQVYGGLAVRSGPIEFGAGLGIENSDGDVGARESIYGIVTRGKFQSATWYEHSKSGGGWFLSNNLYGFNPGRFEGGLRLQRYLGAGPMVRETFPNIGRFQPQLYQSVMFDGDNANVILGGAVNF